MSCWCLLLLLLLLVSLAASVSVTGSAQLLNHRDVLMHVFWTVDVPANQLTVRLRCNADGWFAVGFGPTSKMKGADMVLYSADAPDEPLKVSDRFSDSHDAPVPDVLLGSGGTTDVVNVASEGPTLRSGVWHVTFTRPLRTADTAHDFQFDGSTDQELFMLAAYSERDPSMFIKKHTGKNATQVRLLTTRELPDSFVDLVGGGVVPDAAPLTTVADSAPANATAPGGVAPHVTHGTLMMLSWLLLGTSSTYVSRYLKPLGDVWFRAHVAIGFAIVVGSATAFWVIFSHVQSESEAHFDSVHAVCGLLLLLLAALQISLGYLAHVRFNPSRPHAPIYPDRLHWYTGRVALVASFGVSLMGVQLAGGGLGFRQWPSALLIVCVMLSCALFVAADTRYLAGKRRGEEETALAGTLKRWLFVWFMLTGIVVCVISTLLEMEA
jgi:hypothetical protein